MAYLGETLTQSEIANAGVTNQDWLAGQDGVWQQKCREQGGIVTVEPSGPNAGQPRCGLPNPNGPPWHILVDMRNYDTAVTGNQEIDDNEWWAIAGEGMTKAGAIADDVTDIAKKSVAGIAIAGIVGLLLFMYVEKKL